MTSARDFIQFECREISRQIPANTAALAEACNTLAARSLLATYEGTDIVGSNGNVSQRGDHGGFVITATQLASKQDLTSADFVHVEHWADHTVQYHGLRPPSSEALMHGYLYQQFPDITAIVHVHEANDFLYANPARWEALGVVETACDAGGGTIETGKITAATFRTATDYVILKNHRPDWDPHRTGAVILGATLQEAVARTLAIHQALQA